MNPPPAPDPAGLRPDDRHPDRLPGRPAAAREAVLRFLPGQAGRLAAGRAFLRTALTGWGVPDRSAVLDDVLLAATELLANAERHGDGAVLVRLARRPGAVRLEVRDRSTRPPRPTVPHAPNRPGGHGLLLVDRLAERWGTAPEPDGKTVWADFLADI